MTLEKRALTAPPELRAADGVKVARGYAALFNSRAKIGDWFYEEIAPGAFSETLKTSDVRALINHDPGRVIGRMSAGNLRVAEDERGLSIEVDLPDTTDGRDLAENLRMNIVTGMSFGFRVTKEQWDETGDLPVRTIMAAELHEVSAVTWPAYEDTEIALRSLESARIGHKVWNNTGYLLRKAQLDQRLRQI